MRKALRITAILAGIISGVSAIILGFIYFEDIISYFKFKRFRQINRFSQKHYISDFYDCE